MILVVIPLLVAAAAVSIAFVMMRRSLRAELSEVRTALYKHIQSTSEQAAAQPEKKVAEPEAVKPAPAPKPVSKPTPAPAPIKVAEEEVPAEVLAVIAAAVAHFFGVEARIRGARLAPQAGTSAWAQWGRATVQASHNLSAQRAHV
jgi:hypothetical protein